MLINLTRKKKIKHPWLVFYSNNCLCAISVYCSLMMWRRVALPTLSTLPEAGNETDAETVVYWTISHCLCRYIVRTIDKKRLFFPDFTNDKNTDLRTTHLFNYWKTVIKRSKATNLANLYSFDVLIQVAWVERLF